MALAALQELKHNIEQDVPDVEEVRHSLNSLAEAISAHGPSTRQEVIDADGYNIVVRAWKYFCNTGIENVRVLTPEAELTREASLNALARLSFGFPQIADEYGYIMIFQAFYNLTSELTKINGLRFMRNICVKNETNREKLALEHHIAKPFVHLIKCDNPSAELVRQWCGAARAFTLADDESVPENRSEERTKQLYQNQAYYYLSNFLFLYTDELTLNAVIIALSLLARNEDFCVLIEAHGGLRGLQHVLDNYSSDIQLTKNAIACLCYLFMSPIVREKGGSAPIVTMVLSLAVANREIREFVEVATSCLSFITLRNPCACAQLLAAQGVTAIHEIMKMYLEEPLVLKCSSLILRNVAHISGKIGRVAIVNEACEPTLHEIGDKCPDLIEHYVNPLLHDLGLQPMPLPLPLAATTPPDTATGDQRISASPPKIQIQPI